ncbi:MAG: hypothetical protein A3D92_10790 [Bacteroidetes bacterium RIFCSPHIGHO2_02_FULL_44_7]|nr:MAG: hypothetical protein A3D92_10790 [Bacteroidetes bacterium RIFCSPHIGHO2_02_FULL_44_7]
MVKEPLYDPEIGILVQARTGSTRLPNKMLREFHDGKCILELVLQRLIDAGFKEQLLVVTSTNSNDDILAQMVASMGLRCFRGAEEDVLSRFIQGAESIGATKIIRVCADNPFLSSEALHLLCKIAVKEDDYCSFYLVNDKPVILNHIGVYAEYVRVDALKLVAVKTSNAHYLEHVTNYVYTHPEFFRLHLVPAPIAFDRTDLRLTCDTIEDFQILQQIYFETQEFVDDLERVIAHIDANEGWTKTMKNQINAHGK